MNRIMTVRMKKMVLQWLAATVACAGLVACGGGGASSPNGSTNAMIAPPGFLPANSVDTAYFGESYELLTPAGAAAPTGFVQNFIGAGLPSRTAYQSTDAGYAAVNPLIFDAGKNYQGFAGDQPLDYVDNLLGQLEIKNTDWTSYRLGLVGGGSVATLRNIQEIDMSGKSFSSYLSSTQLAGHNGTFPTGSKAYVADLEATADIYLTQSNVLNRAAGSADISYFVNTYSSPARAHCIAGNQRALVFLSNTQAISYSSVLSSSPAFCVADTTSSTITHAVSSHAVASSLVLDFSNNDVQVTDFAFPLFGARGTSIQHFALMVTPDTEGNVSERVGDLYNFPVGSKGRNFSKGTVRMNKVAMNAVLSAFSLPAIP